MTITSSRSLNRDGGMLTIHTNQLRIMGFLLFARKDWRLLKDESTFVDWQRVKVQESNDEVGASFAMACCRRWLGA